MNHTDICWLLYMDGVIPKNAPPIQIKECKRAFFHGMFSMFIMVTGNRVKEASDEDRVKFLESIEKELHNYLKLIEEGKE